ncbi:MAG: dTMP kinase [Dehalococcoidales bacterium]|nr:dTMP kinase [Dehalococcoidales bacterium]
MALFITFEGGEGSGKSVQTKELYKKLLELDIPVILTHEPGGTPFGNKVERWLKWTEIKEISFMAELLLFNASRAQLVSDVIRPNLVTGKIIICDRFSDSTIAYQGYGRGLDLKTVELINNTATAGLKPDLTILLDIPVNEGLARKDKQKKDRFEQEDMAFHQRVRDGFLKLAANDPERWFIVDTRLSEIQVREIIWQKVNQLLLK